MKVHRSLTTLQKRALAILGLIIALAGLTFLLSREQLVVFRQSDTGLTFSHSAQLEGVSVNEQDRVGGILARWRAKPEEGIELLITLRTEQGLNKAASLTGQELIGIILDTISRTYPERFPGFNEVSRREFEQDNRPAAEVIFSYDGETGDRVRQRFIALMKDDDQAFYLSLQAKDSEFDALNTKFFNDIANSISFN